MKRSADILISRCLAVGLFITSGLAAPNPPPHPGAGAAAAAWCADSEEWAFLGLINQYRSQNGLQPLTLLVTLSQAADYHSTDMANNNYFSHTLPNGTIWSQNMTKL